MSENRRQILNMLAENKINAEEAERLLAALDSTGSPAGTNGNGFTGANGSKADAPKSLPKFLRVLVETEEGINGPSDAQRPTTVNIRVPMQLLRAGVRLASLVPVQAHQHMDEMFSRHGLPLTLSQIKPENLEELIDHLEDLTVDVDGSQNQAKVRVFCE